MESFSGDKYRRTPGKSAFHFFGIREGRGQSRAADQYQLRIFSIGNRSGCVNNASNPRQEFFVAGVERRKSIQPDRAKFDIRNGAEEGTRTPTAFRPPAPKAGASANSATSASANQYNISSVA